MDADTLKSVERLARAKRGLALIADLNADLAKRDRLNSEAERLEALTHDKGE